jgi:F0F1-type ATP synthase membrane subunit c/vacuolar-type H+-ATPase subunit K
MRLFDEVVGRLAHQPRIISKRLPHPGELSGSSIMNNGRHDGQVSRRLVLTGTALALGSAAVVTAVPQARAQEKISQANAKYQSTPKGDQRCDGCVNFQPPNACKFVQGDISPNGWCSLFAPKPKS